MQMSRRDRGRPFYMDQRNDFRQSRFSSPDNQPFMNRRPWNALENNRWQRFQSADEDYFDEMPPGPISNTGRRSHYPNFNDGNDMRRMNSNLSSNNIPSSLSVNPESGPRPLFPPETVERLRSTINAAERRMYKSINEEEWNPDYEDDSYPGPPSLKKDTVDMSEYLREEEATKQTIEEIIMVAQALREKIKKEEELRRLTEMNESVDVYEDEYNPDYYDDSPSFAGHSAMGPPEPRFPIAGPASDPDNIPSLFDVKPEIPSLLDMYVPPPDIEDVIQESIVMANRFAGPRYTELCWNCNESGHRYINCEAPKMKKFCYRCGSPGFDVTSCPYCKMKE